MAFEECIAEKQDVLAAIAGCCERSLDACRLTQSFLDTGACWFDFQIDLVATTAAGKDIFTFEPTEGLLSLLTALRALEPEGKAVSDACGSGH
jgi:hypothetical protein